MRQRQDRFNVGWNDTFYGIDTWPAGNDKLSAWIDNIAQLASDNTAQHGDDGYNAGVLACCAAFQRDGQVTRKETKLIRIRAHELRRLRKAAAQHNAVHGLDLTVTQTKVDYLDVQIPDARDYFDVLITGASHYDIGALLYRAGLK